MGRRQEAKGQNNTQRCVSRKFPDKKKTSEHRKKVRSSKLFDELVNPMTYKLTEGLIWGSRNCCCDIFFKNNLKISTSLKILVRTWRSWDFSLWFLGLEFPNQFNFQWKRKILENCWRVFPTKSFWQTFFGNLKLLRWKTCAWSWKILTTEDYKL